MPTTTTERIERTIQLRHPRSKVWRALTDSLEFGRWFGVVFQEPFAPGARLRGTITIQGYEGMPMEIAIDRMEPERVFSWRWHPGAVVPDATYRDDEMTSVVFELADAPGGTRLTVIETGFERVPIARRARALRDNTGGWEMQMQAIERHLDAASGR
jgi:uncharacterized protein YndB with AHSA1/START domain